MVHYEWEKKLYTATILQTLLLYKCRNYGAESA